MVQNTNACNIKYSAIITIDVNGVEFRNSEVSFNYTPAVTGTYGTTPEYSTQGEPESWEFIKLIVDAEGTPADLSAMIPQLYDSLINEVKNANGLDYYGMENTRHCA